MLWSEFNLNNIGIVTVQLHWSDGSLDFIAGACCTFKNTPKVDLSTINSQ